MMSSNQNGSIVIGRNNGNITPRLRNKQPAVDLAGFFNLLQTAFALHIKTTGQPNGITPVFVESFAKERLSSPGKEFNIITYRIKSATMAPTDNSGSRIPRAPQQRENKQSQDKLDYNVIVQGWWEQITVIFEIWSNDNSNANSLVIWFHKFIFTWAFILKYFQGNGVSNFEFVERLEDTAPRVDEQEVYLRQLSYTFRLENLISFEERQLTQIQLTIDSPGTAPIDLPVKLTP
jgi:hypothetical protein